MAITGYLTLVSVTLPEGFNIQRRNHLQQEAAAGKAARWWGCLPCIWQL